MHAVGASYVADGSKYFVSCGLNARGEFSSAEVLVIPQASSWRATGVVGRAQPHERDIKTQPVSARTLYSGNILSKSAQVGCFQVRHGKRGAPGFAEIRGTREFRQKRASWLLPGPTWETWRARFRRNSRYPGRSQTRYSCV